MLSDEKSCSRVQKFCPEIQSLMELSCSVACRKEWHTAGVVSTALLHNSDSWVEASVWNFFFEPELLDLEVIMFLCTAGTTIPVRRSFALEIRPPFFDDFSLTELCILLTLMRSLYKGELVYVPCITILLHTACQSPTPFYEMHCSNVEFHACISIYPPVLVCHLSTLNLLW